MGKKKQIDPESPATWHDKKKKKKKKKKAERQDEENQQNTSGKQQAMDEKTPDKTLMNKGKKINLWSVEKLKEAWKMWDEEHAPGFPIEDRHSIRKMSEIFRIPYTTLV